MITNRPCEQRHSFYERERKERRNIKQKEQYAKHAQNLTDLKNRRHLRADPRRSQDEGLHSSQRLNDLADDYRDNYNDEHSDDSSQLATV